jgi:glycosyltransferase involved in cell wall biosynthesis
MRAFSFIAGLASAYEVHLLIGGRELLGTSIRIDPLLDDLCRSIQVMPLQRRRDPELLLLLRWMHRGLPWGDVNLGRYPADWIPYTLKMKRATARFLRGRAIDIVHVFRMATLPPALQIHRCYPQARIHLDIDDIESETCTRIAELYRQTANHRLARVGARNAAIYAGIEKKILPRFHRLIVCSDHDRRVLMERYPELPPINVIPNGIALPQLSTTVEEIRPFTFLFIGALNYFPNHDAVVYFATRVLPLLRRLSCRPFRIRIVGAGSMIALRRAVGFIPEIDLVGYVPDVAHAYTQADAVIVPIRAGGGTRIKVLEAFAYRKPVVATRIGVEGITAQPDEEYLQAETAEEFARQCIRLMLSPELRRTLAENGFQVVARRYSIDVVKKLIEEL